MHPDALGFRSLERADFSRLQQWLSAPHVSRWWREPSDAASVERTFGPRVDGIEPTRTHLIEYQGTAIGWIQWYRWSDYSAHGAQLGAAPGDAGLDIALGEPSLTGRGLGSAAIDRFVREHLATQPGVTAIVTDPEEANARSVRAFGRAGFADVGRVTLQGEHTVRRIMRRVAGYPAGP